MNPIKESIPLKIKKIIDYVASLLFVELKFMFYSLIVTRCLFIYMGYLDRNKNTARLPLSMSVCYNGQNISRSS